MMWSKPRSWVMAVLLWGATSASAETPHEERPELTFWVGTLKTLPLPPAVRGFAVRDEGMVEAKVADGQLQLIGLEQGLTELVLFGPNGPVRRFNLRLEPGGGCTLMICDMCKLLPEGHALRAVPLGEHVALRGIAYSLEEARAVKTIAALYPNVLIQVQLDDRAVRLGLLRVNHELWRAGFFDARAIVVGDRVLLSGHFASDAAESRARATIAPYVTWLEERLGLPVVQIPLQAER
jgi:hypothetical protein